MGARLSSFLRRNRACTSSVVLFLVQDALKGSCFTLSLSIQFFHTLSVSPEPTISPGLMSKIGLLANCDPITLSRNRPSIPQRYARLCYIGSRLCTYPRATKTGASCHWKCHQNSAWIAPAACIYREPPSDLLLRSYVPPSASVTEFYLVVVSSDLRAAERDKQPRIFC